MRFISLCENEIVWPIQLILNTFLLQKWGDISFWYLKIENQKSGGVIEDKKKKKEWEDYATPRLRITNEVEKWKSLYEM